MLSRRSYSVLKCSVLVGSLIGLIWQSTLMTKLYLAYQTVNVVSIGVPKQISLEPSISICPSHIQLLDRTKLAKLLEQRGITDIDVFNLHPNDTEGRLTIEDIFDLTPKTWELLQYCRFRKRNSYLMFAETSKCNQVFHVVKFFYLHNVCYRFIQYPSVDEEEDEVEMEDSSSKKPAFLLEQIQTTSEYPGLISEVELDSKILDNVTHFVVSISDSFPRGFDHFPHNIAKNTRMSFRYSLTFSWEKSYFLPPPYETNCRDWHKSTKGRLGSNGECVDTCILNKGAKELHRVISSSLVFDPVSLGHLLNDFFRNFSRDVLPQTTADLRNNTIRKRIHKIENECLDECSQSNCEETKFLTRLILTEHSANENYSFRMYLPDYPVMETNYSPNMLFIEYLLYMCNCVSFWCGLSVCKLTAVLPFLRKRTWH